MGNKYIISFAPHVGTALENGALIKPKRDIIASAKELGFTEVIRLEDLYYNEENKHAYFGWHLAEKVQRKFIFSSTLKSNLKKFRSFFDSLQPDDTIFVQYPLYGGSSSPILEEFRHRIPKLRVKNRIIVIHDLDSLNRESEKNISGENEISFIKSFDHVILHNQAMTDLIQRPGDKCKYYSLDIFDYRLPGDEASSNKSKTGGLKSIFFAGNLSKSAFLKEIGSIDSFDFHVYGPNLLVKDLPPNLFYHGQLPAEEIITEGSRYGFGLVWDGDSIEKLSGGFGMYMKYNNPYKLSGNIASGLPIITSKSAGIAQYIRENNLGILVDSLKELNKISITEHDYSRMLENVKRLRNIITKGESIKKILGKIS